MNQLSNHNLYDPIFYADDTSLGREWYYENNNDKDTLLIAVGDSWTWGDSLGKTTQAFDDKEYRTTHIYGYHLSNLLDSDYINIGLNGRANTYILSHLADVLKNLAKEYRSIKIVFTLTESGRDFAWLNNTSFYDNIKGDDWPELDDLPFSSQDNINFVLNDCKQINAVDLYNNLKVYIDAARSTNINELFNNIDNATVDILNEFNDSLGSNTELYVGRNFTSWSSTVDTKFKQLPTTWCELIAKNGNLDPYPTIHQLTAHMAFDPIIKLITNHRTNISSYKEELLPHMGLADRAIDWLIESPYNSNISTKHPLDLAHRWWAEYIFEVISNGN